MKEKLAVVLVISVLILSGCSRGWSADWKPFFKTEYSHYYFDPEALAYPSDYTARVSVKLIFTGKGVQSTVQTLGREYENLDHSIQFLEINCAVKTLNLRQVVTYSKNGTVMNREEYSAPDWRPVSPKTPYEALLKEVCKPPKRQK